MKYVLLSGIACLAIESVVPEVLNVVLVFASAVPSTYKLTAVPLKLAATWCQFPSLIVVDPSKGVVPPSKYKCPFTTFKPDWFPEVVVPQLTIAISDEPDVFTQASSVLFAFPEGRLVLVASIY